MPAIFDQCVIFQAAAFSIAEYAPEIAARRISELTDKGNVVGVLMWGEILAAIASLRNRPGWLGPPGSPKKPRRSTVKPEPDA